MANKKESNDIQVAYVLGDNESYEKLFEQTNKYNKENNTNIHLESPQNQLEMLVGNRDPDTIVLTDLGALVEKLPKGVLEKAIKDDSIYFISDKLPKNKTKTIGMNLRWREGPTSYERLMKKTIRENNLFEFYDKLLNRK